MIKFLKGLGIFFVAIIVAYFFLIDGIIKSQLERHGSIALQAPFNIGSVTFHLIPTALTLRDIQIGNARLPTHDLIQAEELSLPLSLRDLLAHQLIVASIDVHGLRFNRPHDRQAAPATLSTINSSQWREALQRVQQMLNHPLASNTIDPNFSITGAILADQFKPLFTQITAALTAVAMPQNSDNLNDWQILVRHINIDGAFDFGSTLRFYGTIDNVTPQPKLFDVVTQLDVRNVEGEAAALRITGSLDRRKLAQAALRFDLNNFALTQWSLSDDPELKIIVINAKADIQAFMSLTGNQFDLNALSHFQDARFDIANGNDAVAQIIADVWRRTNNFDIHLLASGDVANPVLKMNSSLDVPLTNALQQLQSASQFAPASQFPQPAQPQPLELQPSELQSAKP